jgi:hypothetical protein
MRQVVATKDNNSIKNLCTSLKSLCSSGFTFMKLKILRSNKLNSNKIEKIVVY